MFLEFQSARRNNSLPLPALPVSKHSGEEGLRPLHLAAYANQEEAASFLLESGAEVNARTKRGRTPLHLACDADLAEMAKILMINGADPGIRDLEGRTPVDFAYETKENEKRAVDLFLMMSVDFFAAVEKNDVTGTKEFLDSGFPPDFRLDEAPIHAAAARGNREVVELLLARGADINIKDRKHGLTALAMAIMQGLEELALLLIERGADPRGADAMLGETLLHWSAGWCSANLARVLLSKGVPADAQAESGWTPLLKAAGGATQRSSISS